MTRLAQRGPLSRCVPPIRWLQHTFIPPISDDWVRISYQPMLYLGCFIAAFTVLIWGDFMAIPQHGGIDTDREFGVFWIWITLSLACPILALGSLWIIVNREGKVRYRGLWLRLSADIGQFTAMIMYLVQRLTVGDYHIYPIVAGLGSATLFVAHLILRDIRRLLQNENLALAIHKGGDDAR